MPLKTYADARQGDVVYGDKDDSFYLDKMSRDTLIGHIDEVDDISEEEIRNYISRERPDLFQRLGGLPVASRDIPMSIHGQQVLSRLHETSAKYYTPLTPNLVLDQSGSTLIRSSTLIANLASRHKQYLEQKVSDGHVWNVAASLPELVENLHCMFGRCPCTEQDHKEVKYWILHEPVDKDTTTLVQYDSYCEYCISTIFSPVLQPSHQEDISDTVAVNTNNLQLDGVPTETILDAAHRLYPNIEPRPCPQKTAIYDSNGQLDSAFRHPSNSARNQQLRRYNLHEINVSLKAVDTYDRFIAKQQEQINQIIADDEPSGYDGNLPSRLYVEPAGERFKKQGMTAHARKKQLKEIKAERLARASDEGSPGVSNGKKSHPRPTRICLCREYEEDKATVRCSAELCSIGRFHIRCTGLERLPTVDEKFFCCYCSSSSTFVLQDLSHVEDVQDSDSPSHAIRYQSTTLYINGAIDATGSKASSPGASRKAAIDVTADVSSPGSNVPTSAVLSSPGVGETEAGESFSTSADSGHSVWSVAINEDSSTCTSDFSMLDD